MTNTNPEIDQYWDSARKIIGSLPSNPPQAWAFGATPEHADELLALVLSGTKTATASSLWDYDVDEPLPSTGDYSIILDGEGTPKAIIMTTEVSTAPFVEVTREHAHLEGEGDRTLEYWRSTHEDFWRHYSENERGFSPDMPVVCERFRLVLPLADDEAPHLRTELPS